MWSARSAECPLIVQSSQRVVSREVVSSSMRACRVGRYWYSNAALGPWCVLGDVTTVRNFSQIGQSHREVLSYVKTKLRDERRTYLGVAHAIVYSVVSRTRSLTSCRR